MKDIGPENLYERFLGEPLRSRVRDGGTWAITVPPTEGSACHAGPRVGADLPALPWTYHDLDRISARLAHALVARGVVPGDRVLVQVEKSGWAIALYLACLRAGAVHLPVNPDYTEPEVAYFTADAEPRLLVRAPRLQPEAPSPAGPARPGAPATFRAADTLGTDGTGSLLELAATQPERFSTAPRRGTDLAAILYTSGTTGRPKGAMLTHGNLAANAIALIQCWRMAPDDVLLHCLPLYHTHGLFVAAHTALFSGGALLLVPKFDAAQTIRLLSRALPRFPSVFMGVPTYYTRLLERRELMPSVTQHVRLFTSGSAPLSAETHRAFQERTGHRILERYGMTETNMIASNPYEGDRRAGTVGFPLPGVELRITDPATGTAFAIPGAAVDEERSTTPPGSIEVRGPSVFPGYWRRPEETRSGFRPDGFFVTGDLGQVDDDGYLTIVGREKDLIITGGLNVYPKEIEDAIEAIPGVRECAVIGVPHPDLGEAVVAVVVPRPETPPEALGEAAILELLRPTLAGYKRPKRVVLRAELPRNAMGKVPKSQLRDEYRDLFGRP